MFQEYSTYYFVQVKNKPRDEVLLVFILGPVSVVANMNFLSLYIHVVPFPKS
jgi:hypothetical protein